MKFNIKSMTKLTFAIILFTTHVNYAQQNEKSTAIENIIETEETTTIKVEDEKVLEATKTVSKIQVLKPNPEDKGKLNQSMEEAYIKVKETIIIDCIDSLKDKKIVLTYKENDGEVIDYDVYSKGLKINNDDLEEIFDENGSYTIKNKKLGNINVTIDDLK